MQHVGDFFKPRRTLSNIDLQKFSNGIEISNDEASKILNKNNSEFWKK